FSSRRRHTISKRDWSSDVCSSDLADLDEYEATLRNRARNIGYWTAILGGAALLIITSIFAGQARDGDASLLLHAPALILALILEIGRASCRERVEVRVARAHV